MISNVKMFRIKIKFRKINFIIECLDVFKFCHMTYLE